MKEITLEKPIVLSLVAILLAISISMMPNSLSYAYVEYDISSADSGNDRYITSSQSSSQGSYCYAPPNATIINSCNSGELSSSENSGYNMYGQ